jgi:hypothetical protein
MFVMNPSPILETLINLLDSGVLIFGLALCFGFYVTWLLLSAKRVVPIPREDFEMLWKLHKQKIRSRDMEMREIVRRNKIVGFECQCRCKYIQNKPIINVS